MTKALEGIVVVALEQAVAAPLATSRLADAGARVIKLERDEGDFARGYDDYANGHSSYFVWLNRHKESCRVDLRDEADLRLVSAMLAKADVFIQNLGPGAVQRLGLGADELRARYPRLITCDISGYAKGTPHELRKAYDLMIQAESGLSDLTGTESSGPSRIGISICDIMTGMAAHAQILQALYRRSVTGAGCAISVSLFDVAAEAMSVPYIAARNSGPIARRFGLAHPSIAPYGAYQATDGAVLLAVQSDREWATFSDGVLQMPGLAADPRFVTNKDRVKNRAVMDELISSVVSGLTKAQTIARAERARIAYAQVSTLTDLITHDGVSRATCEQEGTTVHMIASPAVVDNERTSGGIVPGLGQHDAALREEFGSASNVTSA